MMRIGLLVAATGFFLWITAILENRSWRAPHTHDLISGRIGFIIMGIGLSIVVIWGAI